MTVKILELKPNGQLIHPEFNGYKLSLDAIPTLQKKLDISADKVFPDSNQYSFLHAKLIGLHNHLIGETIEGIDTVYVVDKSWCIKKVTVDNISEKEIQITPAFDIPRNETRPHADYDVCLKLVTESLAVLSDGMGKLHILKTDNRKQNNYWKCLFSEDILDNGKSFVIQDARFQKSNEINNIHCLLYDIQQRNDRQHFSGILYWVKLSEVDNIWKKSHLKEISCDTNSVLHYAYLETSCEALYIISDGCFRFIPNSDKLTVTRSDNSKKYCWSQTLEDITIQFKLPINMNMDSLYINTKPREISVKVNGHNVLNGELSHKIDHNLTNWSVENDILEVRLTKQNEGHTWTSIIPDDDSGEYVVDPVLLSEVQERLSHLCSENEVAVPLGATFSSQQVEECDFEEDKYTTFERLSSITCEVTHKVNINTHTLVLIVEKNLGLPPALALRHDVDAYVWQPMMENDNFNFLHEGTLNAFGYVQASKQQRKFSVCSPDLSYCAICETSHLFIYRQKYDVDGTDLRNRKTGKKIEYVAQQHVVNLTDEILGIYAAVSRLFVLTTECIYVLTL